MSHCSGSRLRSNFRWPQDYFEWKQLIFRFHGECECVTVMIVSAYRLVNLGKEARQVWGRGPGRGSVV